MIDEKLKAAIERAFAAGFRVQLKPCALAVEKIEPASFDCVESAD